MEGQQEVQEPPRIPRGQQILNEEQPDMEDIWKRLGQAEVKQAQWEKAYTRLSREYDELEARYMAIAAPKSQPPASPPSGKTGRKSLPKGPRSQGGKGTRARKEDITSLAELVPLEEGYPANDSGEPGESGESGESS